MAASVGARRNAGEWYERKLADTFRMQATRKPVATWRIICTAPAEGFWKQKSMREVRAQCPARTQATSAKWK
jgi:hypothetical protein